jgi:aminoglycoside 3-N-acetyltransferase
MFISIPSLTQQLADLGVQPGDLLMVHSSYKSLGVSHPEAILQALLEALGDNGTLLMPALTYLQQPHTFHDTRRTPSCVGYLTEYFRTRPGTRRSLHPTHSVCGHGARLDDLFSDHILDHTPCGPHSPFHKLLLQGGKILMLGCGLLPNTSMHAIEELVQPPYLFSKPKLFTIIDAQGNVIEKCYLTHGFRNTAQRYDRIANLLQPPDLRQGQVGQAACHLIDAGALKTRALEKLHTDPFYFVDRSDLGQTANHL